MRKKKFVTDYPLFDREPPAPIVQSVFWAVNAPLPASTMQVIYEQARIAAAMCQAWYAARQNSGEVPRNC